MTEAYQRLEVELAEWIGAAPEHVVACSTGSAALHLAFEALELDRTGFGAEVMVPDFAYVACARAVALAGLRPAFVDCDARLNMDLGLLKDAMWHGGATVGAVLAVHTYGRAINMNELHRQREGWSRRPGTGGAYVVEDLAEAHGVRPHSASDAACWSFFRNKIICGEEGGACWFREPARADIARSLRSQGYTGRPWRHRPRACNYRMTNAQAALILRSLRMFPHNLAARRGIEQVYAAHCPPEWRIGPHDVPWMFTLRVPGMAADAQDRAVAALHAAGIAGARHGFWPLSRQEEFTVRCRRVVKDDGVLSCAEVAAREVIALPIQPGVTDEAAVRRAFDVLELELGKKSRPLQAAGT